MQRRASSFHGRVRVALIEAPLGCKIEARFYNCSTPGILCTDTSRCGNGVLEKTERCDDGNTKSGDGCSSTCQLEAGWQCRQPGKVCVPICGDGVLTGTAVIASHKWRHRDSPGQGIVTTVAKALFPVAFVVP